MWLRCLGRAAVVIASVALLWTQVGAQEEEKPEYVGDEFCQGCHQKVVKPDWSKKRHNQHLLSTRLLPKAEQRGCEGCHGPGSLHVMDEKHGRIFNPRKAPPKPSAQVCLRCHQNRIASARWLATAHADEKGACALCHDAHATQEEPKLLRKPEVELCLGCHPEVKAQFRMNSHHPVLEGQVRCSACHDLHQQQGDGKLLKGFDDLCVTCHPEKRGPFVFEHEAASGRDTDKCLQCHRPHGSPNLTLLEFRGRGLCLHCHTDIALSPTHQARPGNCWQAGCHVDIHGSNRSRFFFVE